MTSLKSGFSAKGLGNIDAFLQRLVDKGQVAGVGASLTRRGVEAYRKSFGLRDIGAQSPARNDSIYRIYSMTKTFTVVAAMTLYEKGLFRLCDPIAEFLPAFAEMKVLQHDARGVRSVVPARTPITFEHLFTMTSGIPYPGGESYPAQIMTRFQPLIRAHDPAWTTERIVDTSARVPLCFQPGEYWMYGFSHDVLGRLIEVLSGKRLGEYLAQTIFEPLGLTDTAFYVPPEKSERVMTAYAWTPENGLEPLGTQDVDPAAWSEPPAFESGGGGLASTLADIDIYARMLLGGGRLDRDGKEGERILSRKTVDLIRRAHLVPSQNIAQFGFPSIRGYNYGLGVRTLEDPARAGLNGSEGEWAWDGMLGTWYCVDPAEELVAVFLIQRSPGSNEYFSKLFSQTVYGALDD